MMPIVVASIAFAAAALAAGIMGFAIQRGATCLVAAVDEIVNRRRWLELASMLEASVWVLGGLAIAQAAGMLPRMPVGYVVTWMTIAGGALLGIGAYINRACVFGALAQLGSGEWSSALTPLGFYVGCRSADALFSSMRPARVDGGSAVLGLSSWLAIAFVMFVAWRVISAFGRSPEAGHASVGPARDAALASRVWSPRAATTVIGITFLAMFLLAGAWAYTDVLAELARGMAGSVGARSLLALALLAGAILGGWTAGRWRSTRVLAGDPRGALLRRRGADGLGKPPRSGWQRRPAAGRSSTALALRVARLRHHVHLDRRGDAGGAHVATRRSRGRCATQRGGTLSRTPQHRGCRIRAAECMRCLRADRRGRRCSLEEDARAWPEPTC